MERMMDNETFDEVLNSFKEADSIVKRLKTRIAELEEENKKLKEENEYRKRIADVLPEGEGHIAEETIQDLQARIKELDETLEHRDSVLSIMYDLLRSDLSDYEQLCMIDVVIDVEVGNEPQNKLREELLDRFWKRDF